MGLKEEVTPEVQSLLTILRHTTYVSNQLMDLAEEFEKRARLDHDVDRLAASIRMAAKS